MIYFSKTEGGFFHDAIHAEVRRPTFSEDGEPTGEIVARPSTLPADAVALAGGEERWRELLDLQAQGHQIIAGSDGQPVAKPREITPERRWVAVRNERDRRLGQTDWTQLPDVPEVVREGWARYRQALRDVPQLNADPMKVEWPQEPIV